MNYDCDACILFKSSRCAKAEGLRWGVRLSKTVKEAALLGPCLSSPASPVAPSWRSGLLGAVLWAGGCCPHHQGFFCTLGRYRAVTGREKKTYLSADEMSEVYQPNTVAHFFCKRFLCCRDSPRFQDEWCTVKTSVTNLREQFKPISPLTTSTPRPYQLQPRHYTVTVEVMEAG